MDQFTVECDDQIGIGVAARLGDLDDSLVIHALFIDGLRGGDGADTIRVFGGPGVSDVMEARETTCSWTEEGKGSAWTAARETTGS